jgi:hypothetical protein
MKVLKPIGAAVVGLLSIGIATAGDQPQQKPGLWQRTTQTTVDGKVDGPPQTSRHCMDAAALDRAQKMAADIAKKNCTKHDARMIGGTWTDDSVCNISNVTMTEHSETRMIGDNKYHMENDVTYSPAFYGQTHSHTVSDGVWLGECKGN